jgi:hypothetical protein
MARQSDDRAPTRTAPYDNHHDHGLFLAIFAANNP